MSIVLKNGKIIDERCAENLIFSGGEIGVCYTLDTDDITRGEKPSATPYKDRIDYFEHDGDSYLAKETNTSLRISKLGQGLLFELESKREDLSEFGIRLPFNFMGKLASGGWENQFLFNSPYTSLDKSIIYTYLTKPNGCNIVVAVLSEADGWKMDYSPYLWGHYFVSLNILSSYDKAYKTAPRDKRLRIAILPVADFHDCLRVLSELYERPFLDYNISGGALGEKISLIPFGRVDSLIERTGDEEREHPYSGDYTLSFEAETTLIPVSNGKRGAEVTVYAYKSIEELYKKSMDKVSLDIIEKHTDGNLCEHQCWASAMLRFLIKHKRLLSEAEVMEYEQKINTLLDIMTEQDEKKAIPRKTILKAPHDRFGAYNVYKSCRVQELFFGITILLDAYRYFGDEKYYEYMVGATDCLLSNYQDEDGKIFVDWGHAIEDYTTVCCPMIPLVDIANELRGKDEARSLRYFESAKRMAEYLLHRGALFPTEGGSSKEAEDEMEDGSISCTALSLLYYCKNAEYNEAYLKKAKEILDLHESWVIKTPICQMHGSSLRWWETQWEGDADGPAICAGHAWTIWRAEADYLYYALTKDKKYFEKAKNGFLTNLSKIVKDGTSYSIYCPDEITGGGFHSCTEEIRLRVAPRLSDTQDCGISRYVWIRINNTSDIF